MLEIIPVIPFVALLLAIAFMPFISPDWWHKNYDKLSYILAGIVVFYYLAFANESERVAHTFVEYVSFISLLFSLFVVSGGIHFSLKGKSTPVRNTVFLMIGGIIANLFGTTGAAMLLIRPYINSNKKRLKPFHIIFFIFIVCNVGGTLTPIGDPPLFLGYLKGVPFFWVIEHLFGVWSLTMIYLLVVFYIIDTLNYKKSNNDQVITSERKTVIDKFQVDSNWNFLLLFAIIGSVFIEKPIFLRELIMLLVAGISYKLTPKRVHEKNEFNFEPIREVAVLFIGIFMTMMPALKLLSEKSDLLGLISPGDYYWATGILSSFLDNAPTYLNLMAASMGLQNLDLNLVPDVLKFVDTYSAYVISISVASVFFGAMTYIGNGPNFMVKSISDFSGLKMPNFVEYIFKYSLVILLPFYILIWYFFVR